MIDNHCLCSNCYKKISFYDNTKIFKLANNINVYSIFIYEDIIAKLIKNYKYSKKTYLHILLAKFLNHFLLSHFRDRYDYILFVPIHPWKFFTRNFNQTTLLANKIAKQYNIEILYDILFKSKHSKAQSNLTRKQRQKNLMNSFKVDTNKAKILTNKNILIIDDVLTTGTTILSISKEINKFKPNNITFLTIARSTIS